MIENRIQTGEQLTKAYEDKWVWDLKILFLHNLYIDNRWHIYSSMKLEFQMSNGNDLPQESSATSRFQYHTQYIYVFNSLFF